MKLIPRRAVKRINAVRITAPETRPSKDDPTKQIVMLSFIDAGAYQQHFPTTVPLFEYAAGTNEPGERPDGLDRLSDHEYVVHLDKNDKAIGLDIVPSRSYRSGVVPASMQDVKTWVVEYVCGGAVVRVMKRPFNFRAAQSRALIAALDELALAGRTVVVGTKLGRLGKVVSISGDMIEVRPAAIQANPNASPQYTEEATPDEPNE